MARCSARAGKTPRHPAGPGKDGNNYVADGPVGVTANKKMKPGEHFSHITEIKLRKEKLNKCLVKHEAGILA